MKIYLRSLTCISLFLIFPSHFIFAQSLNGKATADNADVPSWIKMMDDPNTNYYEAVKTYEAYWKNHTKPAGEEEELSEETKSNAERRRESQRAVKKDSGKILSPEELKTKNDAELMKYHVKRFEQWMREVKPFVQEDGRILTDEERTNIFNRQQEEIRNQKK